MKVLSLAVILILVREFFDLYFAKNSRFRENNIYAQVAMVMLIGLLGKMQY
jgi:multidrug efflux pump subunit AcrB